MIFPLYKAVLILHQMVRFKFHQITSKTDYFVSWYSFSVFTFQIVPLSVLPAFIASAARIAVSIEWSILL